MAIASQKMTLDAHLYDDDGTETGDEPEDGEMLTLPPEGDRNQRIATFLFDYFLQLGISF